MTISVKNKNAHTLHACDPFYSNNISLYRERSLLQHCSWWQRTGGNIKLIRKKQQLNKSWCNHTNHYYGFHFNELFALPVVSKKLPQLSGKWEKQDAEKHTWFDHIKQTDNKVLKFSFYVYLWTHIHIYIQK